AGRIYGNGLTRALRWRRARVYHGIWGVAPYQSLYEPAPSLLGSLPQMPEWYLAVAILMALSTVSLIWSPLKLLLPLLLGFVLPPLAQASLSAARASFNDAPLHGAARLKRRLLTAALHLLQPLARLRGRLQYGLAPWRRGSPGLAAPWPRTFALWSERWRGAAAAGAWAAGTILAAVTLALGLCVVLECAGAAALIARTVRRLGTGGA